MYFVNSHGLYASDHYVIAFKEPNLPKKEAIAVILLAARDSGYTNRILGEVIVQLDEKFAKQTVIPMPQNSCHE